MATEASLLAECAAEPIRVPGAIQPHGRMLVADGGAELLAYSANWESPEAAASAVHPLRALAAVERIAVGESPTAAGSVLLEGRSFDVLVHRTQAAWIFELEPGAGQAGAQAPIYSLARRFLPQMQRALSVGALAELAVAEMKRLTGFGRCLVYRFDENGHGEVLAELCDEGYDSYEGHRFPAADIPAQARDLYRLNHIRVIPQADYQPVPLLAARPGVDPAAIDLSYSTLRSVSPVHLEYMRNMGTQASMSVSIIVRGELWGLISCHDRDPRFLAHPVRAACEHLGDLLSLQIEAKEDNLDVATRHEMRKLTLEIVSRLAESDATLERLVGEPAQLLRLGQATGAAVVLDDQCWTTGEAPPRKTVLALANWVAASGLQVSSSDRLRDEFPAAAQHGDDLPAGMLGISISQVHRHLVLWFRPEFVQTITWAGDPHKQVRASDGRIHPRRSFESWRELVRGRSLPWTAAQLATAAELRQALIGIVLRRAQELAEVATELGRVNKELEAFSYTVSHDLRAPMRHIAGYVDLVLDLEGPQLSDRTRRYLSHVKEASAYAGQLVDALLDFSRMGRSELKRTSVDTQLLVEELLGEFQRHHAHREIDWQLQGPLPRLQADPLLLQVAVRNLLDNAVKYTRGRDAPRITVRAISDKSGNGLEVEDNGVGFQMKYVGKLFGVFQRLHQADEFEGTGIGLASVKRIVERHGGTVSAHGEIGQGAKFGFTLPRGPA
jgi:light-regulated signal transduction histidine kinase (bacteriophytochrome)